MMTLFLCFEIRIDFLQANNTSFSKPYLPLYRSPHEFPLCHKSPFANSCQIPSFHLFLHIIKLSLAPPFSSHILPMFAIFLSNRPIPSNDSVFAPKSISRKLNFDH